MMVSEPKPLALVIAIEVAIIAQHIRTRFTNEGKVLGAPGLAADIAHLRELLESLEKQVLR